MAEDWMEAKRLVEYRLDKTDRKIDTISGKVDTLVTNQVRLEERTNIRAGLIGGIMGAISAAGAWLAGVK